MGQGTSPDLLVLGADAMLHLVTLGDDLPSSRVARTPAVGRSIAAPVWGHDGDWFAWVEQGDDGSLGGTVHVAHLDGDGNVDMGHGAIDERGLDGFGAFALDPSPCGRRLAHLSPGPLGLELAVTDLESGSTQIVSRGAPIYWAWSPDGSQLVLHRGDEVLIVGLDDGSETALELGADGFLAPWWSPTGDEIVFVDANHRLVATAADGAVEPRPIIEGQRGYRFAVDPTGQRVAVVVAGVDDVPGAETHLAVVDRLTGEPSVVIDEAVAGMWWCPQGRRLLAMLRAGSEGEPFVRWAVWDDADATLLAPFQPSNKLATTILPFFEQFAQSHRFWSPTGDRLVTAGVMRGGRPEIFVSSTTPGSTPQPVHDGVLAWWRPSPADSEF